MSIEEKKRGVVLITNWRIDAWHGRTFGICFVDAPNEYKECSYKRGFPFTDPTHTRCAAFALLLGIEQALCYKPFANGYAVAVVTKNRAVADMLIGERAEANRKWASDPRKKPLKVCGYSKAFIKSAFETIDALRSSSIGDVVYVPEEDDGSGRNMLADHYVQLDIDPDTDYERSKSSEEECMSDAKHRYLLRQELLMSNARGSRRGSIATRAQRIQAIDSKKKKKEDDAKKKECASSDKKSKEEDGSRAAASAPADSKSHSDIIAAIRAEELRVAAAEARADTGNVQSEEHGTGAAGGPAEHGAGECQASDRPAACDGVGPGGDVANAPGDEKTVDA